MISALLTAAEGWLFIAAALGGLWALAGYIHKTRRSNP